MPSTNIQTEQLAFDGPLHVAVAVLLGCLLVGLFGWTLWRERDLIGRRHGVLFWTLRGLAVAIVLWMLLAPSNVRVEQTTTRQSVALAVDVSPSMRTVDPPETADEYRWSKVAEEESAPSAMVAADRAVAAATLAADHLRAAIHQVREQGSERVALEKCAAAHEAISRVRIHLAEIAANLPQSPPHRPKTASPNPSPANPSAADPVALTAGIEQVMEGAEFGSLAALAEAAQQGQDAFQPGWREGLVDLEHQMGSIRRRLAEVAQLLAESNAAEADSTVLRETRQSSRLQRVAQFIEALEDPLLEPLREKADVCHVLFDDSSTPLPDQEKPAPRIARIAADAPDAALDRRQPLPEEMRFTDIAGVLERLRQLHTEQPLAAVFLLTDVAHNRPGGRDPIESAAELGETPVYVVPIGNTRRIRDVELKSITAPSVVMKDDEMVVEAQIGAYVCDGEMLRVELLHDGAVIQDRELQIDSPAALMRVRFNIQLSELGLQHCQLRILPIEGELSEENNFDQFQINVTQNQIRVLLADNLPRWEYRYLSQLFRRDAKVECDELLFHPRMNATGERAESKAFPTTVEQWAHYDVVLLGDVSSEQLPETAQQSLVEFVRQRGGTLVMIAGQESMPQAYKDQPLESILPVDENQDSEWDLPDEGFALQVTEAGRRHHALMITDTESSTQIAWDFINRNSPFYWISAYHRAKPTTHVLITAADRSRLDFPPDAKAPALLCWQPVGRGRAVYVASPETFRLRFLRGDRLHYRFWGQLLRWAIASDLATGPERVRIRTDRPDYRGGEDVQVVVQLSDEAGAPLEDAAIEAVAVSGGDERIAIPLVEDESDPGRYLGTFEHLPAGLYHVEPRGDAVDAVLQSQAAEDQAAPKAHFAVRSPLNREVLDTRSDPALAQRIAEATGGQVLPPTAVGEVLALIDLAPIVTESTERVPLWVEWKYLWIVFGCLSTEWFVRKRLGLS